MFSLLDGEMKMLMIWLVSGARTRVSARKPAHSLTRFLAQEMQTQALEEGEEDEVLG